jgi:hypothetical protein
MIGRKNVMTGIHVENSGITKASCFQKSDFCRAYRPVPVVYLNKPYQMYYWNFVCKTPINKIASQLIKHPGFVICGPVILVEKVEEWYHFKLNRPVSFVERELKHLAFASHVIPKPAGRWKTGTHVYSREFHDAMMARLAL